MYKKVKATIEKYDMLKKRDRVLVCVSGGPDSVFLLNALNHLKKDFNITLYVASLDHGTRGPISRDDSAFVKKISSDMGLRCFQSKLNVKKCRDKKLSKEENLRQARYKFFKNAAIKLKANVIATGHTLDDNAETILMRIVKGVSLKGLVGIPPIRLNGRIKIIRPLIETEKNSILSFLKNEHIDFRIDHTNLDEAFLRNKVRKKLLPYLAGYNPRIKFALVNMAESLREDLEFVEDELALKKKMVKGRKPVFINLKDLVVQPKALQRGILKDALARCGANIKKLNFRHWKEMSNFLKFKRKGQSIDLPGNIRITRQECRIVFKPRNIKHL